MKTKSQAGQIATLTGEMAITIYALVWLFFGFVTWDFSITSVDLRLCSALVLFASLAGYISMKVVEA
jgi:hypothetical protein